MQFEINTILNNIILFLLFLLLIGLDNIFVVINILIEQQINNIMVMFAIIVILFYFIKNQALDFSSA